MQIAIIDEGVVAQIGDYKSLFPNTSFPSTGPDKDWMQENNVLGVTVWKPYDHSTQKLVSCPPYIEDNQVFTVEVQELTQEELSARDSSQAAKVRAERNQKLTACDWTQVLDAPVDKEAWATYRQALRDLTEQSGFPWDVQWPSMPS